MTQWVKLELMEGGVATETGVPEQMWGGLSEHMETKMPADVQGHSG